MSKVAEWKKKKVEEIKELIRKYPLFGIVNMENLPSLQLQRIRAQMKGKILIKMAKKRLIKICIQQLKNEKKGIEKVNELMRGMPALIFTDEDPFKLVNLLNKSKSKAPAKAGQIAPSDIIIPAGPTSFAPGPIISELAQVGIKTKVVDGKLNVNEDTVVVKEGEVINSKVADILTRMGIEPMEIGLDVICVYDNGVVYGKEVLTIDQDSYINNIKKAYSESLCLAMEVGYVTKETVSMFVVKAYNEAKELSTKSGILTKDNIKELIIKVENEASNLNNKIEGGN
jgi:large subunit ribosomal protein L10